MADEVKASEAADAPKASEESTRLAETTAEATVAETMPIEGGDVAPTEQPAAEEPKPAAADADITGETTATDADATVDATKSGDDTPVGSSDPAATNGTPASSKKGANIRRKSGAGVPEHKKKTPKKGKAPVELHLDVQPGEMWFVAMKGHPAWPVIVCDDDMLPEALISKRPVSAKRLDGTFREDFREGAKNAKDRRYPVMFLGTNEFAWQVNTELQPFDLETVKQEVQAGNTKKLKKSLWYAYQIAAEGNDLDYFKGVLNQHEKELQDWAEEKAAAEAKKQEKKEKATKRKSTAAEDSEDVEMEDVGEDGEGATKKKASKKRKKDAESDGEPDKPAKTPKTKLKLNNKAPKDASAAKPKKEPKAKKAKAKSESAEAEAEPAKVEEKPLTEAERREKQEKSVLYLRHRLQKGFLSRDQAPKEEEMANMSSYLKQLEEVDNLEAGVIRNTKVHKVLKAIIKLESIPKDPEYQFKERSNKLLESWKGALAADVDNAGDAEASAPTPATNGVKHDGDKKDEADASNSSEKPTDTEPEAAKATNGDTDVPPSDAKEDASAVKADTEPVGTEAETATT
ncbi:hypothetical protein K491DRAFT_3413 [Lophiostoma macrostomum CBS 122681]|uniref:PWWP domain-containing protein n=1 Tax=Lophiostoma macrostomum CBS 122681 TaxID=1314788 RepID=A0A6A6TSP6_9PLEO|nr:hypothetical protein K491DRAFT_3413 [Lophiostoma macrostomum CBS 122681]